MNAGTSDHPRAGVADEADERSGGEPPVFVRRETAHALSAPGAAPSGRGPADTPKRRKRTRRERPFGTYAIALLLLIQLGVNGLDVIRVWRGESPWLLPDFESTTVTFLLSALIFILVVGAILGLLTFRRWGWVSVMILNGIGLFFSIWSYFNGGKPYVSLLLGVLVVFYLNQHRVQAAFHTHGSRVDLRVDVRHYEPGGASVGVSKEEITAVDRARGGAS